MFKGVKHRLFFKKFIYNSILMSTHKSSDYSKCSSINFCIYTPFFI